MVTPKPYIIKAFQDKARLLFEKYNLFQIIRYGLVGVSATSTHAVVAVVLFHQLAAQPTLSNFAGFVSGAIISYIGSYYFTFKSPDVQNGGHKRSLPRFALVWLVGIAINVGLFQTLRTAYTISFELNLFIVVALTPIAQYLMLKFWAFKK